MTLAGWLATNLLILPGCKFCDLMTELKEGKTLQGRWIVPLCFPNVIPLPCTEFFIPEGNQMFQSQATVYCLVLKSWVRLGGYMCDSDIDPWPSLLKRTEHNTNISWVLIA